MSKTPVLAAALVATFALCGAHAQSSTGGTDSATGVNGTGHAGDASMPAEIVPPTSADVVSGSGTSSAQPAAVYHYSPEYRMPTRQEVKNETQAMVRSGLIPHGEASTAFQDRGAQVGSTPF